MSWWPGPVRTHYHILWHVIQVIQCDIILHTTLQWQRWDIRIDFDLILYGWMTVFPKENTGIHDSILTHWGRVTHIFVSKLPIIGSDNGLSPDRRQAIIWTSAGILLIGPLGTNFSEILIGIQTFSFKKMHFKMSSAKWRPFCPGLNGLMYLTQVPP